MPKQTFKDMQDAVDLTPIAHRVRLLRKYGYAFSTIAKKLKVPKEYAKECCVGPYLQKHRPSMGTYHRSPKHRKDRFNQYHWRAYLGKNEKINKG